MKEKHKTSLVWKYFALSDSNRDIAFCNICDGKFSYRTSITNLKKHLQKKHKDAYDTLNSTMKSRTLDSRCQPKVKHGLNPHLSPFLTLKKDRKDYPKYNDEPEQETFEEMEIIMKTRSGIEMTYTTRKKKVSFDLRDNILQKVELISKEEIVTLENEKGKYHISAKKNTEEEKEVVKQKQYETEMMNVIQPTSIINSEENVYDHSDEMNDIRIIEGTVRSAQVEEVIEFCDDEVN